MAKSIWAKIRLIHSKRTQAHRKQNCGNFLMSKNNQFNDHKNHLMKFIQKEAKVLKIKGQLKTIGKPSNLRGNFETGLEATLFDAQKQGWGQLCVGWEQPYIVILYSKT